MKNGQKSAARATADPLRAAMLDTLGPMEPGLVVVSVSTPSLLPLARAGLERQCRRRGTRLGRTLPKDAPVLSIYAGPDRKAKEAQALAVAQRTDSKDSPHAFKAIGTRDGFAWCTDEGLHVLLPMLSKAKGWVTFAQGVEGLPTAILVDALCRIRGAAKQAKVFAMLFLVTKQPLVELRIQDFADAYVLIDQCEPDPGVVTAFSVECVDLADLHELGIGRSMCSVSIESGRYTWRWTPFISAKLMDRVIWNLRAEDRSLAEIGRIAGMDKSTVQRHLAAMPHAAGADLRPGWIGRYADVLDLNLPSRTRSVEEADEPGPEA